MRRGTRPGEVLSSANHEAASEIIGGLFDASYRYGDAAVANGTGFQYFENLRQTGVYGSDQAVRAELETTFHAGKQLAAHVSTIENCDRIPDTAWLSSQHPHPAAVTRMSDVILDLHTALSQPPDEARRAVFRRKRLDVETGYTLQLTDTTDSHTALASRYADQLEPYKIDSVLKNFYETACLLQATPPGTPAAKMLHVKLNALREMAGIYNYHKLRLVPVAGTPGAPELVGDVRDRTNVVLELPKDRSPHKRNLRQVALVTGLTTAAALGAAGSAAAQPRSIPDGTSGRQPLIVRTGAATPVQPGSVRKRTAAAAPMAAAPIQSEAVPLIVNEGLRNMTLPDIPPASLIEKIGMRSMTTGAQTSSPNSAPIIHDAATLRTSLEMATPEALASQVMDYAQSRGMKPYANPRLYNTVQGMVQNLNQALRQRGTPLTPAEQITFKAIIGNALLDSRYQGAQKLQSDSVVAAVDTLASTDSGTTTDPEYAAARLDAIIKILDETRTARPMVNRAIAQQLVSAEAMLMPPKARQQYVRQVEDTAPSPAGPEQTQHAPQGAGQTPNTRPTPHHGREHSRALSDQELSKAATDAMERMGSQWKNRAVALRYFIDNGYTPAQAAGIVGNFCVEAGTDLNPAVTQVGGEGIGIGQWSRSGRFGSDYYQTGRTGTLMWYAATHRLRWDSMEAQLGFTLWELENTYTGANEALKNTTNVTQATAVFMDKYESPGIPHFDTRVADAHDTLNTYEHQKWQARIEHHPAAQSHHSTPPAPPASPRGHETHLTSAASIMGRLHAEYGDKSGELSSSELMPLGPEWPGQQLYPDAALNFQDMAAAFQAAFGYKLDMSDSYRSYDAQVSCYNDPAKITSAGVHMCAYPGTSNHGWGMAIDFGSHIGDFSSAQHQWMNKHAIRYGWAQPDWARADGSKPEPWHWEYVGNSLRQAQPGGADRPVSTTPESSSSFSGPISAAGYTTPLNPWKYSAELRSGTPYDGYKNMPGVHTGQDFTASPGDDVLAVRTGVVSSYGDIGCGITAMQLKLDDGKTVTYEHIQPGSNLYNVGDTVQIGQKIAEVADAEHVGDSSCATGPHLHVSIGDYPGIPGRYDPNIYDETDNPLDYLPSAHQADHWARNHTA